MSYEVTATRRRPQHFEDLVGQEFVAETLKNSIKSQKIAHAYLFSGPRGCGKTSTARILSKALNCQHGPTDKPCGECQICREITKGSCLDVIEIDGASNTSVENIRQIKDEVQFPPSNCRYKVYIIDEVHMLSTSAFNALLKTIEEPPEYVIFIFATTELQKVPATIKSRCQQYNFRLVSIDKVKECLAQAAAELGVTTEDEALFWIARESTGSMRDAYTLFDQVVAFSSNHLTYEKIRDKLGLVGIDRLNSIFEACAGNQTQAAVNLLDEFLQAGVSIEQLISNSADYLRSLLLIKTGITKEALLGNSAERYSRTVLEAWSTIQLERGLSLFLQLYRDIRYSLAPRYELELAFSRICWLNEYVSPAEVKKAIDSAQALLAGAPPANPQTNKVTQRPEQTQQGLQTQGMWNSASSRIPQLTINDDSPEESASHPFYDGGSLPPEQTVNQEQPAEKKPLDPRLSALLNTPGLQETEGPSPVISESMQQEALARAKTEELPDEEWTNTDTPPEDTYYPDDETLAEQAEQTYEAYTTEPVQKYTPSAAQVMESFTTANGATMSIAQLKGNVIASFSVSDRFTANTLEKTGDWKILADSVETTLPSEYDLTMLRGSFSKISEAVSKIVGKQMTFKADVKKAEVKTEQKELPLQVKILVDTFKGTVIGR